MAQIDLDAARQARAAQAEADGETHELVFGGQSFYLPPRMPLAFTIALNKGDFERALESLFGSKADVERFLKLEPALDDMVLLTEEATRIYGLENVGESLASGGSSRNGGASSRPISNGSTGSTSASKRSGRSK